MSTADTVTACSRGSSQQRSTTAPSALQHRTRWPGRWRRLTCRCNAAAAELQATAAFLTCAARRAPGTGE